MLVTAGLAINVAVGTGNAVAVITGDMPIHPLVPITVNCAV
jgi:hypothetical protein